MKLTLTIESQDPQEIHRAAQALAGIDLTGTASAAEVKPAARAPKKEAPAEQPKSPPQESAAQTAQSASAATTQTQEPVTGQADVNISEDALMSAVNKAAMEVGNGGPGRLKAYIAKEFGGTMAAVRSADAATKVRFIETMGKIATKELTIP